MSPKFPCVENAVCIYFTDYNDLLDALKVLLIIPIAIELFLYGIFVVFFGFCIYVFRRKFTPGKLYIIATFLFFILATVSLLLDLVGRCMLPLSLPIVTGPESNYNTQPVEAWTKIVVGLDYIFLIAGLLGDMILIYRCYRLWNSNKRIIIIPILGLVAVFIVWVINETNIFVTYEVYILTTLGENVLLTGLIAGRVWWQNRKVTKLIGRPDRDASRSQNLLGPILESGSIFPAVLIATVISYQTLYRNFIFEDDFPATFIPQTIIISPCALTQAVGIASTMIMVRIGLGIDSSGPQSRATIRAMDAEARGSEMADIFQQDPYPESISPFRLRYSHLDNYLTDSNVESAPIYLDRPRYTYTPGRKETELRMG